MGLSLIVDKINGMLEGVCTCNFNKLPTFSYGDPITQLVKTCSTKAPFSKVIVLYSEKDFTSLGKELTQKFLDEGLRPLNIIINESKTFFSQSITKAVPEDVRVVASICTKLNDIVFYLANELKIKGVVVIKKMPCQIITQNVLSCDGANIILDEKIKIDFATEYSLCIGKIISLFDIRLNGYLKINETKKETEEKFSKIIDELLSLNVFEKEDKCKIIAIKFALEVLENEGKVVPLLLTHEQTFYLLQKLTDLKNKTKKPTNFIYLAKEREKRFGENYLSLLKSYKQISNVIAQHVNLQSILQGIGAQAQKFLDNNSVIKENFEILGGKHALITKETVKDIRIKGAVGKLNCANFIMYLSGF